MEIMGNWMSDVLDGPYKDLKLKIQGLVPAGQELHRQVLFDQLYSSIPKDPEARVGLHGGNCAKGLDEFSLPQWRDVLPGVAGHI